MSQLRQRKARVEAVRSLEPAVSWKVVDSNKNSYGSLVLLCLVFLVRLMNALCISTFFQADEYYQLLEIAHFRVFGYGYVTWEWREKLRSAIHPMIYVAVYSLASALPKYTLWLVFYGPKIINAVIATAGDWATYKFARAYLNSETQALETLAFSILSGFNMYVITRSFSNTLEMVLTAIGLSLWSWNGQLTSKHLVACAFGMVTCILRPTNGLLWLYLGVLFLVKQKNKPFSVTLRIVIMLVAELVVILAGNCAVDYWFYGELTFPLVNFIEFNVIKNLSIFYGAAPWHFYLFQAVPILTLGYLPLLIVAFYYNYRDPLTHIVAFVVAGYLCVAHKEFRFIYALQPLFLVLTCKGYHRINKKYCRVLLLVAVVANVVPGIFFSEVNERGVIDIMAYLRDEVPEKSIVGFLTPCHSTPWQSHLHSERMENQTWFLTCEPPLHLEHGTLELVRAYRDISDQFYDDPANFLRTRLKNSDGTTPSQFNRDHLVWPDHLIAFEALQPLLERELVHNQKGEMPLYRECRRFFNSYFHWDPRRRGDLIVYCRNRLERE